MDPNQQEFIDLVDCQPAEMKDIPPGRLLSPNELKAECERTDPIARHKSLGDKELYFGKHRGKTLKEVPHSYLTWVLGEQAATNSFRRFQRDVREFLGPTPAAANKDNNKPRKGNAARF